MARRHTFNDAIAVVETAIAEAQAAGREKLAPLSALSGASGVSHPLLLKAIRHFVVRGVLQTKPGSGTFLTASTPHAFRRDTSGPPHRKKLFERVADDVIADVRRQRVGRDSMLPGITSLRGHYGVSYRTMRRALDHLTSLGMVNKSGRLLQVVPTQSGHEKLVVVCFVRVMSSGPPLAGAQRDLMMLQELCGRRNLRLELIRLGYVERSVRIIDPQEADKLRRIPRSNVLGVIMSLTSIHEVEDPQIAFLANSFERPIALLDDTGNRTTMHGLAALKGATVFRLRSGVFPGTAVASYLLAKGHCRVAYFSHGYRLPWAQNRYEGVRVVYDGTRAGESSGAVRLVTPLERTSGADSGSALAIRDRLRAYLAAEISSELTIDEIHRAVDELQYTVRFARDTHAQTRFVAQIADSVWKERDCTAWICETDRLAVHCLEHCKARGIRVPNDLSIIGFDDSFDAFTHSLTSYNFNRYTQLSLIFDHFFSTTHGRLRTGARIEDSVERVGFVTERETVAPR